MRRRAQRKSPIIFAGLLLALWPRHNDAIFAEAIPSGVTYRSFVSVGSQPELPNEFSEVVSTGSASAIDFDWFDGPVLDTGLADGVLIEFIGWFKAPTNDVFQICAFTDDGFMLYLDGSLIINDWWDRGPQCGSVAEVSFQDGMPKQLMAYYYENGGGAVARLLYFTAEGFWTSIPSTWYVNGAVSENTTTTSSILNSTTSIAQESSTPPVESTFAPEPPASSEPMPEPEPKPLPDSIPETLPEPTPEPEPSIPEETLPFISVEPEPQPAPEPELTPIPSESEPPATEPQQTVKPESESPEESVPETFPEESQPSDFESASNEELLSVLVSEELSALSIEQVTNVLQSIEYEELTEEETQQLISALNESSDDVKSIFEETVNVYGGQFDSYVPSGSKITVGERRVLIAVTAVTVVAGASTPAGRRSRK